MDSDLEKMAREREWSDGRRSKAQLLTVDKAGSGENAGFAPINRHDVCNQ